MKTREGVVEIELGDNPAVEIDRALIAFLREVEHPSPEVTSCEAVSYSQDLHSVSSHFAGRLHTGHRYEATIRRVDPGTGDLVEVQVASTRTYARPKL